MAVFKRETAAGYGVIPYFLGKDVVYLLKAILIPAVFSIQYAIIGPRIEYKEYLIVLLGVGYASFGSGLFISATFSQTTAQMYAVLLSFLYLMTSGFNPAISVFTDNFGNVLGQIITGFSPLRWQMELLQSSEWYVTTEFWQFCTQNQVWNTGMDPDQGTFQVNKPWKLWLLFGLGVFFRIAAIISLRSKAKK